MDINLRRLQHYIALAEESSFARAAVRVHISQPALSRSIQTLESDLGLTLIDRAARQFTLTPAGRKILERARRVVFESRSLERDAGLLQTHALGELSFGVGALTASICLPQVLLRLRNEHPGLRVRADVNSWSSLWGKLHKESIDFFVGDRRTMPGSDTVTLKKFAAHMGGWHVGPGHPLHGKPDLSVADLLDYPFAFVPLPERIKLFVRKRLQLAAGQEISSLIECNDFSALKKLAMDSDVILFSTDSAIKDEVDSGALSRLHVPGAPEIEVEMAIAWLTHRTLSPAAEIAIDIVSAVIEQRR